MAFGSAEGPPAWEPMRARPVRFRTPRRRRRLGVWRGLAILGLCIFWGVIAALMLAAAARG